MGMRTICFFVFFISVLMAAGCNEHSDAVTLEDDTLITFPSDTNISGMDTDDHNTGNWPTNTLDSPVPAIRPEDTIKKPQ